MWFSLRSISQTLIHSLSLSFWLLFVCERYYDSNRACILNNWNSKYFRHTNIYSHIVLCARSNVAIVIVIVDISYMFRFSLFSGNLFTSIIQSIDQSTIFARYLHAFNFTLFKTLPISISLIFEVLCLFSCFSVFFILDLLLRPYW